MQKQVFGLSFCEELKKHLYYLFTKFSQYSGAEEETLEDRLTPRQHRTE